MSSASKSPDKFRKSQAERYDLQSQLIDAAARIAVEEKVIDQTLLDKIMGSNQLLGLATHFRAAPEEKKAGIFGAMQAKAAFSDKELKQLGKFMTLLTPVLEAANAAQENAQENSTAQQILTSYFSSGVKIADKASGHNAYGMPPEKWLDAALEAKEALLLSLINTAHPTNFYTPDGREYQKALIDIVSDKEAKYRDNDVDPFPGRADATGVLNEKALGLFAGKVRETIKKMQAGTTITYNEKVTVGEETDTEKQILKAQDRAFNDVNKAWNSAVAKVVNDKNLLLNNETRQQLARLNVSTIEHDKKLRYEQRSWIQGGADKDGRRESTDVLFYKGYKDWQENGVYKGPILDLRENAEVRKKLLGALITSSYKYNTFKDICKEFCANPFGKEPPEPIPDFNSKDYFLNLSEEHQSAFLQHLMKNGINVMSREEMRTETVEFNKTFYDVYKQFLADHSADKTISEPTWKAERPTNPHTPYTDLSGDQRDDLLERMAHKNATVTKGWDSKSSRQVKGGFNIIRMYSEADPAKPDAKREVIGFTYQHSRLGSPLASDLEIPNGEGTRSFNDAEKLESLSYLRRLIMVNHAVDEQKKHGAMVVEREQAANFENASDFFAQMYLYQQAGLIAVEKGKVTEAKIGIMPLFETANEMERAGKIIDDILKSDLAESYYKTRGKAEFMVGYSDGAKSGGNFASHILIRECERVIQEKFEKKFGDEVKVRFMRGPGRGENRGGTRTYDRQYLLHHDDVNRAPVNDQTVQGDLPIRMQLDDQFAARTMAEMTVSTMAGAIEARREKSPLEQQRTASFEAAMAAIAKQSKAAYEEQVFSKKDECDDLLKAIIKNPDASSRAIARANTAQKGLGPQRAITVEYGTAIMGLMLHDFGLNTALKAFAESGQGVLDEKGNKVTGQKALDILARDCPLFREEMKLAASRQHGTNSVFTHLWTEKAAEAIPDKARAASLRAFVTNAQTEQAGLGERCDSMVAGKPVHARTREDYSGEPFSNAFAAMVQAILASNKKIDDATKKDLYFTLQAPISNKPTLPMKTRIPGTDREQAGLARAV